MAKKASKKKKNSTGKKSSGNVYTKIITIILAVIIVGFIFYKLLPETKSDSNKNISTKIIEQNDSNAAIKKEAQKEEDGKEAEPAKPAKADKPAKKPRSTAAVAKSIEGCWMSTTGGAVLTMKDFEYRIDFMGVDSGKPIIGTYLVENNIITFSNKQDPCKETKGTYEVDFDKHEISFKCKNDDCTKRKSTLVTDWEWLDE